MVNFYLVCLIQERVCQDDSAWWVALYEMLDVLLMRTILSETHLTAHDTWVFRFVVRCVIGRGIGFLPKQGINGLSLSFTFILVSSR